MLSSISLAQTQLHCITTDAELESLRDDWNRLAGDVPFRRFEWLITWWRHYRLAHHELFVLLLRDEEGELVGLAPWYIARTRREGQLLRFLGSGEVCSDHLTLLTVEGLQAQIGRQVANWLASAGKKLWDRLELVGLDSGDIAVEALAARLGELGYCIHWRSGLNCWRLKLPQAWDAYLMTLSKSRRERTRQLVRRGFDTGRVTCGVVEEPDELEMYFRRLVELHQKRRTSVGQRGMFTSPRYTAFHRDIMRQFFDLGRLRLWWTEIESRPAAIEYSLIGGDTVYFYQSGLEPELAEERPGWLEKIGSLRNAIEDGYRYFDFLRGDEAYKQSWGATVQPTAELRVVAPQLMAHVRHKAWAVEQNLRSVAKSAVRCARRWKIFKRSSGGEL